MVEPLVWIDPDACVGCGLCVEACGRKLISMDEKAARVAVPVRCVQCGHCKAVCPVDAPQLTGLDPTEFCPAPRTLPAPDDLLAFLRARRSIRNFRRQMVEREKLAMIIEAGRYAPTGQNRQALGFLVAGQPAGIERIRRLTVEALLEQAARLDRALADERGGGPSLADEDQPWRDYPPAFRLIAELTAQGYDPLFHFAPAVVAVHVHPHEAIHPEVEAGLAAMQMALMATSLGLGTCYCGLLDYAAGHSAELRQVMGLPEGHHVPISFMLGYPEQTYPRLVARRPARVTWL
jgi:nitroreductase/NAD-dependent dihydropyrimidine dehydrogenase PreA subunit